MPDKSEGDGRVRHSGAGEPDYDDDLELLKVNELGDHTHSDSCTHTAACFAVDASVY